METQLEMFNDKLNTEREMNDILSNNNNLNIQVTQVLDFQFESLLRMKNQKTHLYRIQNKRFRESLSKEKKNNLKGFVNLLYKKRSFLAKNH